MKGHLALRFLKPIICLVKYLFLPKLYIEASDSKRNSLFVAVAWVFHEARLKGMSLVRYMINQLIMEVKC